MPRFWKARCAAQPDSGQKKKKLFSVADSSDKARLGPWEYDLDVRLNESPKVAWCLRAWFSERMAPRRFFFLPPLAWERAEEVCTTLCPETMSQRAMQLVDTSRLLGSRSLVSGRAKENQARFSLPRQPSRSVSQSVSPSSGPQSVCRDGCLWRPSSPKTLAPLVFPSLKDIDMHPPNEKHDYKVAPGDTGSGSRHGVRTPPDGYRSESSGLEKVLLESAGVTRASPVSIPRSCWIVAGFSDEKQQARRRRTAARRRTEPAREVISTHGSMYP